MAELYKKFVEYFPKYPASDEHYPLVSTAQVVSTLVSKEQRRVKASLLFERYADASVCAHIAEKIKDVYSLSRVQVRCCCPTCEVGAHLDDFLSEAVEDFPALGGYVSGGATFDGDAVCVPVRAAGADVLEKLGMAKSLGEYFFFKFRSQVPVRFTADMAATDAVELLKKKEDAVDRTPPVSRVAFIRAEEGDKSSCSAGELIYGKPFEDDPVRISSLADGDKATVSGFIDAPRKRTYVPKSAQEAPTQEAPTQERTQEDKPSERAMIVFNVEDGSGILPVKIFSTDKADALMTALHEGDRLIIRGGVSEDKFSGGIAMRAFSICRAEVAAAADKCIEKRVELHSHTFSSALDAPLSAEALIARASDWGHPAIAITDHASLRSLPQAVREGERRGMKIIGGMEAYLVGDVEKAVFGKSAQPLNGQFTVFDIETTGLSVSGDRITEIGAVKVENGEITEEFSKLVNPEITISAKITDLTGISNEMVADAPKIDEILPEFLSFAGDSVLVAHNANFDCGFIRAASERLGLEFNNAYIDTVPICRSSMPELRNVKLDTVAEHMGLGDFNHHRACDDARMLARIFLPLISELRDRRGVATVSEINASLTVPAGYRRRSHVTLLSRDDEGMRALGELCTLSYLDYYYRKPCLPRGEINRLRGHLLVGSACMEGEIFEMLSDYRLRDDILEAAEFYDFFELQPLEVNMHLVDSGRMHDTQFLRRIYTRTLELAKIYDKPVVATGDVHFLEEDGALARTVLVSAKNMRDEGNRGPLYLRSTEQMLKDFDWLGQEKAHELVIDAPLSLAAMCATASPLPDRIAPVESDGSVMNRLDAVLAKLPEEAQYITESGIKGFLCSAIRIKDVLPQTIFIGDMRYLRCAYELELTDTYLERDSDASLFEGFALEMSIPDNFTAGLQGTLENAFGSRCCPWSGTALTFTQESAKHTVVRYEEESRRMLREMVENRISAAMAGVVRQLRTERGRLYIVPRGEEYRGLVPLSGTAENYFTHYEGSEYDGRLLAVIISKDPGARMLRICENLTGIPARDIDGSDESCASLHDSADELYIEQDNTLENGLAGCTGLEEECASRLLWYKLNYPQEFYCAYFSVFPPENMAECGKKENIHAVERAALNAPSRLVEYEMLLRDIEFSRPELMASEYSCFVPDEQGNIVLPLCSVADFSEKDGDILVAARKKGTFVSGADLLQNSGVSRQGAAALRAIGLGAQDDMQLSLL